MRSGAAAGASKRRCFGAEQNHTDPFRRIFDLWVISDPTHDVFVFDRGARGRAAGDRRAAGGLANSDPTGVHPSLTHIIQNRS